MWQSFNTERTLRTVHRWLGVMILPWVIAIGFTGLYLNHSKFFVHSAHQRV